jgi:serine protease Do
LTERVGAEPPNHGLILTTVPPEGAAGRAGLQRLDVLLAIDGQKLEDTMDYNKALGAKQPGDFISVTYWSKGSNKTIKIKLDEIRGDS